jgi:hypothetical protein
MNTDTLHDTFKDLEADARALDPDRVLAAARRRRRRRTALTSVASLGVAAVTVTSFALAGTFGSADDAQVAGSPAAPVDEPPVIGDNTWYQLSESRWVRTTKSAVQLADKPERSAWTGFTNWRNESSLARGWSIPRDQDSWETVSALRHDVRRVVIHVGVGEQVTQHEAKIYRLASVPGWRLAYVEYPVELRTGDTVSIAVDAYGADGKRLMHCPARPHTHGLKNLPDGACTTG